MAIAASFPTIKPSLLLDFANVGALDPRVTFSRSTTATYYDGVTTAKAEENLLTYSQEFDNAAWNKTGSSATANTTTAPDGTTTADSLIESSGTSEHYAASPGTAFTSGLDYTLSCFVKPNGRNFFRLSFASTAFPSAERFAYFDVQNGVLGTVAPNVTATITSVGNGWYRCAISRAATASATTNTFVVICDADNNTIYTGDGTSGLYIWGAQLEQRSSVTAYTPTTTQPITNYIPVLQTAAAGVPRFDHNPTTGDALGLLIEEARTNLLTYSEDFGNAYWTASNSSLESNTVVAPDGTLTGDKLVENTTASVTHKIESSAFSTGIVSGTSYTFSAYIKPAGRNWAILEMQAALGGGYAWFDLSNGTVGTEVNLSGTSTITPVGNGWYRCSITDTSTGGGSAVTKCAIFTANVDNATSYTGDDYSGIYIWGAQLEAGAFPTSYIPTVASQVTRNADAASMTGTNFSSWFNNGEGTIYSDIAWSYNSNLVPNNRIGVALSSAATSTIIIYNISGTSGGYFINKNGTSQGSSAGAAATSAYTKSAVSYELNNINFSYNGASVPPDTTAEVPIMNTLNIGSSFVNSAYLSGYIRKIAYYPQALTATNLQALTA